MSANNVFPSTQEFHDRAVRLVHAIRRNLLSIDIGGAWETDPRIQLADAMDEIEGLVDWCVMLDCAATDHDLRGASACRCGHNHA